MCTEIYFKIDYIYAVGELISSWQMILGYKD